MKYSIQIFGCQMNQSDAQRVAGLFESLGMVCADGPAEADIFIAVMCSFTAASTRATAKPRSWPTTSKRCFDRETK